MKSVLQDWVMELGLRHQGVLLAAVGRGCDTAIRHDPSKLAQRLLRGSLLNAHSGREVKPVSYIVVETDEAIWNATMLAFVNSWDHYPNHYVVHFVHACEIIGYYGPKDDPVWRYRWRSLYERICRVLHVNPETKLQLDERLNADEVAFGKMQVEAYGRTDTQ